MSFRRLALFLSLVLAVVLARAETAHATYDIVIDIDWTILSPIPEADRKGRTDLLFFEGESYAPAPFALRALELLLARSDVRLHIFSGGEAARNLAVLSLLKTSSGKTLLEEIEARGGHVWSASDRTTIGETGGNIDRYRKRIEKLLPTANPQRLILIDDQTGFGDTLLRAIPSYGLFNDRKSFDAARIGMAYEPANIGDWRAERQRWLVLSGLLDEAFARDRSGDISFRDFLLGATKTLSLGSADWKSWAKRGRDFLLRPALRRGSEAVACERLFSH